jgi:hypothetical protein
MYIVKLILNEAYISKYVGKHEGSVLNTYAPSLKKRKKSIFLVGLDFVEQKPRRPGNGCFLPSLACIDLSGLAMPFLGTQPHKHSLAQRRSDKETLRTYI